MSTAETKKASVDVVEPEALQSLRDLPVEVQMFMGLGSENTELTLRPESLLEDVDPLFFDTVAVKVSTLGHQDEFPRSWDWENILTMLEPGEELLYVLDHQKALRTQTGRPFTLWLGVRFPQRKTPTVEHLQRRRKRARILISQFQRQAFPGSEVQWLKPTAALSRLGMHMGDNAQCYAVSGLPSPRGLSDDKKEFDRSEERRNYRSINDVVESLVDLQIDYRIAFVVGRVPQHELQQELEQTLQLRDAIHPYISGSYQIGLSEGTNYSSSRSTTSSRNESFATQRGESVTGSIIVLSEGDNWSKTTTSGASESTTVQGTYGESEDQSWSETRESLNALYELADKSLERSVEALHEAHGTGGYRWASFVFADDNNAELISQALVGVLSGSKTKDFPFNRFPVHNATTRLFLSSGSLLDLLKDASPILPLSRACDALLLPEAELPGMGLRRNVFLGRTLTPPEDARVRIQMGPDAFSALAGNRTPDNVELPYDDVFKHMLVAGTTGSGKTTRVVETLNRLEPDALSVVVFETAKRTYRTKLQREGREAPLVYMLGSSRSHSQGRFRSLRVNPFYFELGTSLKQHIAMLSDALAELMPTEAMIAPLMRRAVENAYKERGWDIEAGRPLNNEAPTWPTVTDFAAHVRTIAQTLNYGPEVTANYRGALESRAAIFTDATFQDIFSHGGNVSIDELFPKGRDIIIEVEDLPASEVDIRAFVMTLLLSRLRAVQARRNDAVDNQAASQQVLAKRDWLIVVEEAHNVLDREFEQHKPADESNAGRTLLRCIERLLQEGREMRLGVMVVDQSPMRLARGVIANTGTKVIMRLEDGDEMEEIGRSIGLKEEEWEKLGYLQTGEALIKASFMDAPVKTAPFPVLTAGVASEEQRDERDITTSQYGMMEKCWAQVLLQHQVPDEQWCKRLLDLAYGDTELALFSGVHLLADQYRNDDKILDKTKVLRDAYAQSDASPDLILKTAQVLHNARSAVLILDATERVARLMYQALIGLKERDELLRVSGFDIRVAAGSLAIAGFGSETMWQRHLYGLATASSDMWREHSDAFSAFCESAGGSATIAPMLALLKLREQKRVSLQSRVLEMDALDYLLHIEEVLKPVFVVSDELHTLDSKSKGQVTRRHIITRLQENCATLYGVNSVEEVGAFL